MAKIFIFDFWDTLMRYDYDGLKANQAILDHAIKNPNKLTAKDLLNQVNLMFTKIRAESKKLEVKFEDVHRLVHQLNGLEFNKSYHELESIFINNAYSMTPHPHAVKLLNYLKQNGFRIGLLSNTILKRATVEAILSSNFSGIDFDPLILSSEVVFKKPHPEIYSYLLSRLKAKPSEVYFVGDNFEYDVKGPIQAGMFAFFYNHSGAKIKETINNYQEINSLDQIIDYLEDIKK